MSTAAADQPAVDRNGEHECDRQRHGQAPPEQAVPRPAASAPGTATMNRLSTISIVVIDTVSEARARRVARRRLITASSGRIVSPYPNVNASTIESTIEAALPSRDRGRDHHAQHLSDRAAGEAVQRRRHRQTPRFAAAGRSVIVSHFVRRIHPHISLWRYTPGEARRSAPSKWPVLHCRLGPGMASCTYRSRFSGPFELRGEVIGYAEETDSADAAAGARERRAASRHLGRGARSRRRWVRCGARGRDPNAFGMFSCSKATNEVNFIAQKFARVVIGTNNIDSCNRT